MIKTGQYSHSDSSVVARARKDAWIGRMPGHGVDDTRRMGFELGDWGTRLSSPDVHMGVCEDVDVSLCLKTPKTGMQLTLAA